MTPTKFVVVTLLLPCRADVPAHVVKWMNDNLAEHAAHEFDTEYEPDWCTPVYEESPLVGPVQGVVGEMEVPAVLTNEETRAWIQSAVESLMKP